MIINSETKSGSGFLYLRNEKPQNTEARLTSAKILSKSTGKIVPAQVLFKGPGSESAEPFFMGNVPAGRTIKVEVLVTGFSETGEYDVRLLSNGNPLTNLIIVNPDIPFNLSFDVPNPDEVEFTFRKNRPGLIVIKNEDPWDYLVDVTLLLRGTESYLKDTTLLCKAHSGTPLKLTLPCKLYRYWFTGLFKDEIRNAKISMKYHSKGNIEISVPSRSLPVSVRMQYYSENIKKVVSSGIIFIILLLGGAGSLFLNLWIPNRLKRIDLKKQINRIAVKTRSISTYVDSDLRVNIRVERMRMDEQVRSTKALNPNSGTAFAEYKREIEMLGQRVQLISELDNAARFFEEFKGAAYGAPASVMDDVKRMLDKASEILKLPLPGSGNMVDAESSIKSAREKLQNMSKEDSGLAAELAERVKYLDEVYRELQKVSEKVREIEPHLRDLFSLFDPQNKKYQDKINIKTAHYHWLSSAVERLNLLRHYIETWEKYPNRRDKMSEREDEFIGYLNNRTWNALQSARQFRREFEENIFADEIAAALKKEAFHIEVRPTNQPKENEPVSLGVIFENGNLNTCSAKNEFTCEWDFGYVGKEKGWKISHYFRNQKEAVFKISFFGKDGKPVMLKNNSGHLEINNIEIRRDLKKMSDGRAKIEIIKFLVAFLVALFALFTGAREQILKLDVLSGLIGVFLIGFGADTIKNLITKKAPDES